MGVRVHGGRLGEGVKATLGEQLDRQRHIPSLRLQLTEQLGVKILKAIPISPIKF